MGFSHGNFKPRSSGRVVIWSPLNISWNFWEKPFSSLCVWFFFQLRPRQRGWETKGQGKGVILSKPCVIIMGECLDSACSGFVRGMCSDRPWCNESVGRHVGFLSIFARWRENERVGERLPLAGHMLVMWGCRSLLSWGPWPKVCFVLSGNVCLPTEWQAYFSS